MQSFNRASDTRSVIRCGTGQIGTGGWTLVLLSLRVSTATRFTKTRVKVHADTSGGVAGIAILTDCTGAARSVVGCRTTRYGRGGRWSSNASVSPIRSFAPTAAGYSQTYFAALSAGAAVGNAITVLLAAESPAVIIYIHTNSGVNTCIGGRSETFSGRTVVGCHLVARRIGSRARKPSTRAVLAAVLVVLVLVR